MPVVLKNDWRPRLRRVIAIATHQAGDNLMDCSARITKKTESEKIRKKSQKNRELSRGANSGRSKRSEEASKTGAPPMLRGVPHVLLN